MRRVRTVRRWLLAVALAAAGLAAVPSGAGAVTVTNLTTVPGVILDATPSAVLYRLPNVPDTGDPQDETLIVRHLPSGTEETVPIPAGRVVPFPGARLFDDGVLFSSYLSDDADGQQLDEWHFGDSSASSLGPGFQLDVAGSYAVWTNGSNVIRRNLSGTETSTTVTTHGNTLADPPSVASNGDVVYTDDSTHRDVHRWQSGTDTKISNITNDFGASPVTDGTNVVYAIVPPCCRNPGGAIAVNGTALDDTGDDVAAENLNRDNNYAVRDGWTGFTGASQTQVRSRSPGGVVTDVGTDGRSDRVSVRDVGTHGQVAYYRQATGNSRTFLSVPGRHPFPFGSDDKSIFWSGDHWYVIRGATLARVETDTAITAQPAAATNDPTAHFEFASTASNPGFACTLDDNLPVDCNTNEFDTGSLSEGPHTFTVTSTDNDLNETDATPASVTWNVDTTAPAAFSVTSPSDGDVRVAQVDFSWPDVSDPGPHASGVAKYELTLDGQKQATFDGDVTSTSLALPDGEHTWSVRAIDAAGNHRDSPTASFTVDSTPPTTPVLVSPADNATLTTAHPTLDWNASTDSGSHVVGYNVTLDGHAVRVGANTTSYTPPAAVADGDHEWSVIAIDAAGNGSPGDQRAFTIDTAPPSHPGPPGISINDGDQFTNDPNVTLTARWPHGARNMLIANDGGFGGSDPTPVAFHVPWRLDSSGPERLPKTVYVRYLGGGAGNETYTDDIILDETSPSLLMARFASAGRSHRYTIKLRAHDAVSGVHKVQVARRKSHPGRALKYHRTLKVHMSSRPRYVRVRDRAGNWSHWRKIARAR